jgi:hypothetical protein
MRIAAVAAVSLLIAAPAIAQNEMARRQATEISARVAFEKPVTGAPYSAETIIESTQTLADGNRINRKTTGRVYRDGEGRVRREEDRPDGTMTISIVDPVAGFNYSLDPVRKTAWKTPAGTAGVLVRKIEDAVTEARRTELESKLVELKEKVTSLTEEDKAKLAAEERMKVEAARSGVGPQGARGGRGGGAAAAVPTARGGGGGGRGGAMGRGRGPVPGSTVTLERKTLEGVAVEGHRTTTVIPAGQIGNEQPITITSEEWKSPELSVLVMTRHSDPRTGESSYRLQNIIRAEPDRSLFMVPADYTIRETGIRRQ